jgi:hypothetical protein
VGIPTAAHILNTQRQEQKHGGLSSAKQNYRFMKRNNGFSRWIYSLASDVDFDTLETHFRETVLPQVQK